MAKLWTNIFLLFLLTGLCILQMFGTTPGLVKAEDETTEEYEDADSVVEEEEGTPEPAGEEVLKTKEEVEEEEEVETLKAHPDALTSLLFIKPVGQGDLLAGREAVVLVGMSNEADKQFVVQTLEASIRYPQDFSYHIQNFSVYNLEQTVDVGKEASFEYRFTPSESLSSRPFGLVISLNYKDDEGVLYSDAVFNATVNISEPDEGVDGEIFFMYIFLVVMVLLLIVGITQVFMSIKKKHIGNKSKVAMEMGTQDKGDVDYDWLPQETLQELKKSPKPSPVTRTSPRQRNKKRITEE